MSLRPLQIFYFLSFGALGSLFPYFALLLETRGLTPSHVGWAMMIVPVSNAIIPPLWGVLADALRARLLLLRVAAIGSAITVLLMLPSTGFVAIALAIAVFSFFRAPLISLSDAAGVEALRGRSRSFGHLRVYGSIGFGLFVLALGWFEASKHPTLLISTTAGVYLLAAAATLPLRAPSIVPQRGLAAELRRVLMRPAVLTFLATTVVYYAGHATYDIFFGLHVSSLGLGDRYVGIGWAIGTTAEIAVLLLGPRILGVVRAEVLLTACAMVAMGRWIGMAYVVKPSAVLVLQSLHGVTYGLWYLSLVTFIQGQADDRTRTTLQSIALSCAGLGAALASVAGGTIFEQHGGFALYRVAACMAAVAVCGYGLLAVETRHHRGANPTEMAVGSRP